MTLTSSSAVRAATTLLPQAVLLVFSLAALLARGCCKLP